MVDSETELYLQMTAGRPEIEGDVRDALEYMCRLEGKFITDSSFCTDPSKKEQAGDIIRDWFGFSNHRYGFWNGHEEWYTHVLALGGYIDQTLDANRVWRALNDQVDLYGELPNSSEKIRVYRNKFRPKKKKN